MLRPSNFWVRAVVGLFGKKRQIASLGRDQGEGINRPVLPGTSDDLDEGSPKRFFEAFVLPNLNLSRERLVSIVLLGICGAQAVAIAQLIPLKERIPFIAEFDDVDGKLKEDTRYKVLGTENIQDRQVNYYARRWARALWSADSQLQRTVEYSGKFCRGAASREFLDFLNTDRAAEKRSKTSGWTRELASKPVITRGQGQTLFLHLEILEKTNGDVTARYRKLLQVDYVLLPDSVPGEDEDNPLGLFFTHFTQADQ